MQRAFFLLAKVLLIGWPGSIFCQVTDSSVYKESIRYVIGLYQKEATGGLSIYSGLIHHNYPAAYDGSAYFGSADWYPGSVIYDHELYENVFLKYDAYGDQLVIRHPNEQAIVLPSNHVQQFAISEHIFLMLQKNNSNGPDQSGYYEKIFSGSIQVLARHKKSIQASSNNPAEKEFLENTNYYIIKDNKWHEVSNNKTLLKTLSDKLEELQQYLRKNKLNISKDTERTIIEVAKFYNSLNLDK